MTYYGKELYHHGIFGQRKGIRRYQNPDGTWTTEGKRRRRARESSNSSEERPSKYSEDARRYEQLKNKKPYELSNEELKFLTSRESSEKSYYENRNFQAKYKKSKIGRTIAAAAVVAGAIGTAVKLYEESGKAVKAGKDISFKFKNKDLVSASAAAKEMEEIRKMKEAVKNAAKNM